MARRARCGRHEAETRLELARVYLESAETMLGRGMSSAAANASAGNAVLAGIAASDAICCIRLRERYRGDEHTAAAGLLQTATPDGKALATTLRRLLGLKDAAQYGADFIPPSKAENAVRWARRLTDRATEELAR